MLANNIDSLCSITITYVNIASDDQFFQKINLMCKNNKGKFIDFELFIFIFLENL
jgi:hypothetical protein